MMQRNDAAQAILDLFQPGIEIGIVPSVLDGMATMSHSRPVPVKSPGHARQTHAQSDMTQIHGYLATE